MNPFELQVHESSGYGVRRSLTNGGNITTHAVRETPGPEGSGTTRKASRCGGPRMATWGGNLQGPTDGLAVVTCRRCIQLLHDDGEKAKAAGLDAMRAHRAGLVELRSPEEHAQVVAEAKRETVPCTDHAWVQASGQDICSRCLTPREPPVAAPGEVAPAQLGAIHGDVSGLNALFGPDTTPTDPRAAAEAITHAEVRQLRERAIAALHDYKRGLAALNALPGASERVTNALRALGAVA